MSNVSKRPGHFFFSHLIFPSFVETGQLAQGQFARENSCLIGLAGVPAPAFRPGGMSCITAPPTPSTAAPAPDGHMIGYAGASAQHRAIAEPHGTRKADLPGNDAMAADLAIMGNLDQVIDLGSLSDDGIGQCPAIYGGVGADVHPGPE